jgi:hypothetical protein
LITVFAGKKGRRELPDILLFPAPPLPGFIFKNGFNLCLTVKQIHLPLYNYEETITVHVTGCYGGIVTGAGNREEKKERLVESKPR